MQTFYELTNIGNHNAFCAYFLSCSKVLSFCVQWSAQKAGDDLTDHPWVMMMRGLLLLKPQEVMVCSCRGSSMQVSSPPKNSLKTELLTYGFFTLRNSPSSESVTPQKSNGGVVRYVCSLSYSEIRILVGFSFKGRIQKYSMGIWIHFSMCNSGRYFLTNMFIHKNSKNSVFPLHKCVLMIVKDDLTNWLNVVSQILK